MFPAAVASLGALGVLTELTIDVEPAYFIEETRVMRPLREVLQELQVLFARQRSHELHSVDIWINPYVVHGDVWCVVGTRKKVEGPAHGKRGFSLTHGDAHTFEALCQFIKLKPGDVESLVVTTADGKSVEYELELLSYAKK